MNSLENLRVALNKGTMASLALALVAAGCVSPMARVKPPENWNEFVSEDGRFSIRFPAPPTQQTRTVETGAGDLTLRIYISEGPDKAYTVVCMDYPPEVVSRRTADELLDGTDDDARSKPHQKVVSFEPIKLGDIPGRAIKIEDSRNGGMIIHMRAYLVGSRMYTVGVTTATEQASEEHAQSFCGTFEVRR